MYFLEKYWKIFAILLLGSIYHILFFHLNEILKVADSFAYLQMAEYFSKGSTLGFGSGWFGFFYSIFLIPAAFFGDQSIIITQTINLILYALGAWGLFLIAKKYLFGVFIYIPIIIYYLSPTLLHFNIHVLSENIYIPLCIWLFYTLILLGEAGEKNYKKSIFFTICSSAILAAMYYTRAEAFIYLASVGLVSLIYLYTKKISIKNFFALSVIFLSTFFLLISPYILYLHSITGKWGLSNKGSSNMRQAILRGQEKMDDAGFEQAVAELTDDKKHLKAGFAGGMKYDAPEKTISLSTFLLQNPSESVKRIGKNYLKFFYKNNSEIFWGKSPELFLSKDSFFYKNPLLILPLLITAIILIYGIFSSRKKNIFFVTASFFILAFFFFSIFFILTRYFLFLVPIYSVYFALGLQNIYTKHKKGKILATIGFLIYIGILLLSTLVYYNEEKQKDSIYELKKIAGLWLKNDTNEKGKNPENIFLLERFPIVTYYSGSLHRWITPYTDKLADIKTYADFNDIEYLIVDSSDFQKYRKSLDFLLDTSKKYKGVFVYKIFSRGNQKVIIYAFKK